MDNMEQVLTQLAENQKQTTQILSGLVAQQKGAFSATSGNAVELHGNGSLWGSQSVERDVITAHYTPQSGLSRVLPRFPSVVEDPRFGILTGYTATSGSEPTNPCDPAPSGYQKACLTTAQFGRVTRDTNEIDITKVMLRRNRGDFTDLVLRGRTLGMNNLVPSQMDSTDVLNVVTRSEMVVAGVNLERKLTQMLWQGSPSNNTSGGGYKEFPGLDSQIATGHVDAETNTACPAVDSLVMDFNYDEIGGTGRDIVEYISEMEYHLTQRATRMGLDPVQWVFFMRPQAWFELSAVWPCRYMTDRCGDSDGTQVAVINDSANTDMRDDMRNGMYIIVNGNRYPVITDDGIFEHTNVNNGNLAAAEYASSIYMVPLTINGNFPVTYMEHLDYRQAAADISLLGGREAFWTDDGVYLWVFEQNRGCYRLGATTEPRVVLRTPHLAGRVDAVKYTPLEHLRSPFPDNPYFADGGVSLRADASAPYTVWS